MKSKNNKKNRYTFQKGDSVPMKGREVRWLSNKEDAIESGKKWGADKLLTLQEASENVWDIIKTEELSKL